MKHSASNVSWLLPSVAWGCMLAWFWSSADRTEAFLSGRWIWTYLAPAVVAAIVLPALGAMADLRRANGLFTAIAGALALLLLLLGGGDGISEYRLGPFWVVALLCAALFQHGALKQLDGDGNRFLPALGLVVSLGILVLTGFVIKMWAPDINWMALLLVPAALVLVVFALTAIKARESGGMVPGISDIMAALREMPIITAGFRDLRTLLLFGLLFAAGMAQLQFTVWNHMAAENFPLTPPNFPLVFLSLVMAGALATRTAARTYGIRRMMLLSSLLSALLVLALYVSRSSLEVTLMISFLALPAGLTWGLLFSLVTRFSARETSGQVAGYAMSVIVLGILLGKLLELSYRPDAPPFGNMLLFLAAMGISLRINPGRGAHGERPDDENPREVEWDWTEEPVTGLARHNLLSRFTKFLAQTMVEIFFGRIRIVGREHLRADMGAVIVANHPNTFFDPLLITALVPGRLHYWAKSTLWRMPMLGSILDRMGAIPVYRRQDAQPGGMTGNQRTFATAAEKLNGGAHMLIFPEGVSEVGLSLKPIKTGAARLGLDAMAAREWGRELVIIPVGIDYAEPSLFRGGVTLRIGEPLGLSQYQESWQADPRGAVGEITTHLTTSMTQLLPHLDEPQLEELVHQIQELYGERLLQILAEDDETAARLAIARAVNHYQALDPDTVFLFSERMEAYHRELARLSTPENHPPIPVTELLRVLASMVSLASFGLVTNWLPYRLTGRLVNLFNVSPVWIATLKMTVGVFLFAVYYLILGFLFYTMFGTLLGGLALFCIIFSAFVALGALDRFAFRLRRLKTLWQAFWTQDTNEDLDEMKISLIQDLERFRESYAFYAARETET